MDNENFGQINELRKVMFDQIQRLNNTDLDLEKELKRANAITSVGTVIINSVKVGLDYQRLALQKEKAAPALPEGKGQKQLGDGK